MDKAYIYIVFSKTPYFIGRLIRSITGETYNHVSIALDADLSRMYGFARRYHHTPLYGGFVRESISRYHINGKHSQISVCKIPITPAGYARLEALFAQMESNRDLYIYNHFSAMCALIRKPIKARDAYTCVEFCVEILYSLGIDLDPEKYYSVGDILKLLLPYQVYTGEMYPATEYDTAYFAKRPIPHPTHKTIYEICKLLPRLAQK